MTAAPPLLPPVEPPRRRRRLLLPLVLLLVLALVATAVVVLRGRDDAAPAGPGRAVSFPVAAVAGAADGSAETLRAVVAHERLFVAVGLVASGGRTRPVFLWSDDLGQSWQQGEVEDPEDLRGPAEAPYAVTTGPNGLVALGTSGVKDVSWTSQDGRTWTRRDLDRAVFTEDDSVAVVRGVPTGYVAVGASSPSAGAQRGVLWDSLDGVTWRRRTAAQLGVAPPDGRRGDAFREVAVDGDTWVLAGAEFDDANDRNKDNIAFWRSTDGGRRFARAATPLDIGGDNNRSFVRGLVTVGGTFHAVGQGGDFDLFEDYDPVLLSSPDGASWTRTPDAQLAGDGEDFVVDVAVTGDGGLVVVGSTGEGPLVLSGPPRGLRRSPQLVAGVRERPVDLSGVAAIGDVVVAVGDSGAGGDDDALLLRSQGSAPFTRVPLPEVDALAEATVSIGDVAAVEGGLLAVGAAGGDGAAWTSADGVTWTQLPLPAAVVGGPRGQFLGGVTAAAEGPGWTAVGERGGEIAPSGLLVSSTDGRTAVDAGDRDLLVGPSEFADRSLYATAVRAGTVVHVGRQDDGDDHSSALVLRRGPDGRLTPGRSAARPVSGGVFDEDRVDDLRGGPGRSRGMSDVAAGPGGFIAVGYVGTGLDRPFVPAVWGSTDGLSWGLTELPLPDGTEDAYLEAVTAVDRGWVAVGTATRGELSLPYAWTSPDGLTWTASALAVDDDLTTGLGDVIATPSGVLVLGSSVGTTGERDGERDAAAWISREGGAFEPLPLPGVASGEGQQTVAAAALLGDTVVALGSTVTEDAVRTLVLRLEPEDLAPSRAS